MIIGIGCDIVAVKRIKNILEKHGINFVSRILTPEEQVLYHQKTDPVLFLAGRWAAKEAAAKALSTGIGKSAGFTDFSILNTNNGAPELHMSGTAAQTATSLGARHVHLSISHDTDYAVAYVIMES